MALSYPTMKYIMLVVCIVSLGNCLKKIPKRQVVLEQSPSFYSPSAHQSLGTYKQSSTKIVHSSPSRKSSGSSHTSTPASSYKPSHKTYSSKQSSCAKPVFSSISVKNTTTTTIQDTEICANVTVMEIVEGPGSTFCENTTFTPKTFSRTFLMDVVEKLCIDDTITVCNSLVDTEVVFMEKNICNKACTKDCTASSVSNCEEGSREVEEETLSEECKEELKEECTTGQEVCTTEMTEECTSTSSHPNYNNPVCMKVPVKVCKATTECQEVPVQSCSSPVPVSSQKSVPTCQCKEEAVLQCQPKEEEVCQVVSEKEIVQTPREVCKDITKTVCEDRNVSVPIPKIERCVDLSEPACQPFDREVCITVPTQEAITVEKEVCSDVPSTSTVSTSESHITKLKQESSPSKPSHKVYTKRPVTGPSHKSPVPTIVTSW